MTGPNVRPATRDDAPAIAEVHVASWRAAYTGIVPQAILDGLSVERRADFWHGVASEPGETSLWVVELDGRVAGFASTGPARDDDLPAGAGEVQAIYVDPAVWRNGCGRALLQAALDELRDRGFDPLVLWVLSDNRIGRAFYARQGWRPDGTSRTLDFNGTPIEEVRYRSPG